MDARTHVWIAFVAVQLAAIAVYFAVSGESVTWLTLNRALIPVVWITVGVWAVVETPSPPFDERPSYAPLLAGAAAAYFGVLAYFGGVFGTWDAFSEGLTVTAASPGWGPLVSYTGELLHLHLVPFMVVGYAALSYLVFVSLLTAGRSLYGAAIGIFSCIGCTVPLATAVAGFVGAGATASVQAAHQIPFELEISTVVLVVSVLLLRRYGVRYGS